MTNPTSVLFFKYCKDLYIALKSNELFDKGMTAFQIIGGAFAVKNIATEYIFKSKSVVPYTPVKKENQSRIRPLILKIIILFGNLSLIGSAATTAPMISIWKKCIKHLNIEHHFASGKLFAGERLYKCISIASFILSIPSTTKFIYDYGTWAIKKVIAFVTKKPQQDIIDEEDELLARQVRGTRYFVTMNTIVKGTRVTRHLISPS